jgi:exodeoxyribonuclease V gamma subunit
MAADEPWPTALRTGLAWLGGKPSDAATAYDGGEQVHGEREDPCLARLYPDFQALHDAPCFAPASERLYAPLRDWIERHVTLQPFRAEAGDD